MSRRLSRKIKRIIKSYKLQIYNLTKITPSSLLASVLIIFLSYHIHSPIPKITKENNHNVLSAISPTIPPIVSAKNVFILDINTNEVIYEKNADQQIYPASTTKMMTALIAYESQNLDEELQIGDVFKTDGVRAEYQIGETVSVEELIYDLLVQSANDASEIIAASDQDGGRSSFIQKMNQKALNLNMKNTVFKNPSGLDEPGHLSSASDLVRLGKAIAQNEFLSRIVASEMAIINTPRGPRVIKNVNELLGRVNGMVGIKTGYTDLAGQSLVSRIKRDNKDVLIALMGSKDRFSETQTLVDWVFSSN